MTSFDDEGGTLVVATVGGILLVATGAYVAAFDVVADENPLLSAGEILESINLLVVGALVGTLIYGAHWLARSHLSETSKWRVGFWCAGGFVGAAILVTFLQADWLVEGVAPPRQWLIQQYFVATGAGAVSGLLVGINNAQVVEHRNELQRQRDAFTVVNEFLRHHVLNGMQVVQGYTNYLHDRVDEPDRDYLDRVEAHGEDIVGLVQRVNALMTSIAGETATVPMDLSAVVEAEVAARREAHPDVEFAFDDGPRVHVLADQLLDEVVGNLVDNAVEHGSPSPPSNAREADVEHDDAPAPRVTVTVDRLDGRVRLTVADNGPGVPESERETIFEAGEAGSQAVGQGLGLYLVDVLVTRYEGAVWVEDSDLGGAAFHVDLPRAAEP